MFEPTAVVAAPYDGQIVQTSKRGMIPLGIGSVLILALPAALHKSGSFELTPGSIMLPLMLAVIGCMILCMCVYAYLRPVTLTLDHSGFQITGAFVGFAEQQWADVERFSVVTTDVGPRIACALRPGSVRQFRSGENIPGFGWVIKGFVPSRPEDVVDELNAKLASARGQPVTLDHEADGTSAWVEPETIEGSSLRYFYSLAGWIFAIAFIWYMHRSDRSPMLLVLLVLSPFMLRLLWLGMNPPVLALDHEGLTVPGLLPGRPTTLKWVDLQDFVVVLPRRGILDGPRRIGYYFRPGHEPAFSVFNVGTWFSKNVIPSFYTLNTEDVVARLNTYRQRACSP